MLGDAEVTPVPPERVGLSDAMSVGEALNLLRIHRAADGNTLETGRT